MVSFTVHPDFVITNPPNLNAVHQVCDAGVPVPPSTEATLNVTVLDLGLTNRLAGERIMFHPELEFTAASPPEPEVQPDFAQRGSFQRVTENQFNDLPEVDMRLSSSVVLANPSANAVHMEAGQGEISGVRRDRLEELSMFRETWTQADINRFGASGLYQLSVTVRATPGQNLVLEDPSETVMLVEIQTVEEAAPHDPTTLQFELNESDFFDAGFSQRGGAFEVVLGEIEVRQAVDGTVYIRPRDANNTAWTNTGLFDRAKIIDLAEYASANREEILEAKLGDIDIRVTYVGNTRNVAFELDAVSLTDPRTYAMFYPQDPDIVGAHANARAELDARLNELIRDNEPANPVFPNLRFILGPEQMLRSAYWAATTFAQQRLQAVGGTDVSIYCAAGISELPSTASAFNRRFASGFYGYPISLAHERPVYTNVDAEDYHTSLNAYNLRGFVHQSRMYNELATNRQAIGNVLPWIPYVQNHSNLFFADIGQDWNDEDWLREPTAAELRHQCNITLAFATNGLMMYQFVSSPGRTTERWWPPDLDTWEDDRDAGPRDVDPNAGSLGFLDQGPNGLIPRTCDWNGENKWDSAGTYIRDFLSVVGDIIANDLTWERARIWSIRNEPDAGTNDHVNEVVSFRQDLQNPDVEGKTYVVVSEFVHRNDDPYLLVLNGRTHPEEGHRHITVKLTPNADPTAEWRVTNVLTNDIWIVRPTATPDRSIANNGFTDYFPPGTAALYRIEPIENETMDFTFIDGSGCDEYDRNIFIEPQATLRLKSSDILAFAPGTGIECNGELIAIGSTLQSCNNETWDGVIARDNGVVDLQQVSILNAGIVAGSGASVTLDEACQIRDTYAAMANMGATILSNSTSSTNVVHHVLSTGNGFMQLIRDASTGGTHPLSTALHVTSNSQVMQIDECAFSAFWRGLRFEDADLQGDADNLHPMDGGNNSIRALNFGAMALGGAVIDLGSILSGPSEEALNEIILTYLGYHAWADASSLVLARQCWWEPVNYSQIPPLSIVGDVRYTEMLTSDPIPFTSSGGESLVSGPGFAKLTSAPPPGGLREQVRAALAQGNRSAVRHLVGQFLASPAASAADAPLLRFVHRSLRKADVRGGIDSLLQVCLSRSDLESKILGADIAMEDSLYTDALDILNAYSFVGSTALFKRSLIRKAILHPLSKQGGYVHGLKILDTLLAMNDSTLLPFINTYPVLYSRLTHQPVVTVPKGSGLPLIDRFLPDDIDVWPNCPNPFSDVTSFTFKLGEDRHVRLAVYDAMGREVAVVTDADYSRGVHSAVLRSAGLPSGLYFYRLTTDTGVIQRKMLLMR